MFSIKPPASNSVGTGAFPGSKAAGALTIRLHLVPSVRPICLYDVDRENILFTSDSAVLSIHDGQGAKQSHTSEVNTSLSSLEIPLIYTDVLCSQQPSICPFPEPHDSTPRYPILFH